jgi:hypothetical protein
MSLVHRAKGGLAGQLEDALGQRSAMRGNYDRTQPSGSVSSSDDLRC